MTTPQPTAGADPLGIGMVAPTGSGKGKDPYGLGALATVQLTPGGLFPVRTGTSGTATAQQILDAFVNSRGGDAAVLQQRLYMGGFYSGTYTPMTHLGLIRPEDIAALTNAVQVAAQQSAASGRPDASGQTHTATPVDLGAYIAASAQYGSANGKQAASVNYETTLHNIVHDDPNRLGLTADSVGQEILGRKPEPAEKARIIAFLDRQNVGEQRRLFGAQDSTRQAYVQRGLDVNNPDATAPSISAGVAPGTPVGPRPTTASTHLGGEDLTGAQAGQQTAPSVDDYMKAASAQESGGNYTSVNADSGAQGRFQIMPGNWPSWSREAGLGPGAAKTPQNQDRVARFKMQQYYDQFGSWDAVAVAWYGGPGAAQAWLRDPNQARFNRPQGKYPSINEYVKQVTSKLGGGTVSQPTFGGDPSYAVQQPNIPLSNTIETTNFDPTADAAALLRKNHPVEAGAHDMAKTFDTFLGMLGVNR